MKLKEAIAKGLVRLRRARWANPMDHVELCAGGLLSVVWSPHNVAINGRDGISLGVTTDDDGTVDDLEEYTGPLPGSPEYVAEERAFAEAIARAEAPR